MSEEARIIRAGIRREKSNAGVSLQEQREAWESSALEADPVPDVLVTACRVGGVFGRWFVPEDARKTPPLVWCHGGGLVAGSSLTHGAFAARLANASARPAFVPDYRLLPENAIDDPMEDLSAILDDIGHPHAVLGGDSSGAALAIACAIDHIGRGRPMPTAIVPLSGAFDATLAGESIDEGRDPQLDCESLVPWQHVVGEACELDDPRLSPLFADLRGVPPTFLLCGEDEVWRSDSERMSLRLAEAGVTSELPGGRGDVARLAAVG